MIAALALVLALPLALVGVAGAWATPQAAQQEAVVASASGIGEDCWAAWDVSGNSPDDGWSDDIPMIKGYLAAEFTVTADGLRARFYRVDSYDIPSEQPFTVRVRAHGNEWSEEFTPSEENQIFHVPAGTFVDGFLAVEVEVRLVDEAWDNVSDLEWVGEIPTTLGRSSLRETTFPIEGGCLIGQPLDAADFSGKSSACLPETGDAWPEIIAIADRRDGMVDLSATTTATEGSGRKQPFSYDVALIPAKSWPYAPEGHPDAQAFDWPSDLDESWVAHSHATTLRASVPDPALDDDLVVLISPVMEGGWEVGWCTIPAPASDPAPVDTDGDGIPDTEDAFPNDPDESTDSDGDGVGDNADECTNESGPANNSGCPEVEPTDPPTTDQPTDPPATDEPTDEPTRPTDPPTTDEPTTGEPDPSSTTEPSPASTTTDPEPTGTPQPGSGEPSSGGTDFTRGTGDGHTPAPDASAPVTPDVVQTDDSLAQRTSTLPLIGAALIGLMFGLMTFVARGRHPRRH